MAFGKKCLNSITRNRDNLDELICQYFFEKQFYRRSKNNFSVYTNGIILVIRGVHFDAKGESGSHVHIEYTTINVTKPLRTVPFGLAIGFYFFIYIVYKFVAVHYFLWSYTDQSFLGLSFSSFPLLPLVIK